MHDAARGADRKRRTVGRRWRDDLKLAVAVHSSFRCPLFNLPLDLCDDRLCLREAVYLVRDLAGVAARNEMQAAVAPRSCYQLRGANWRWRMIGRCCISRGGDPGGCGEGYCAGCHDSTFLALRLVGVPGRGRSASQWAPQRAQNARRGPRGPTSTALTSQGAGRSCSGY